MDLQSRRPAKNRVVSFAVLIILVLLLFAGILISRIWRAAPALARLSIADANGSLVPLYDSSSDFSYVQFLPNYEKARVDLFVDIVRAWKTYSIRFILVAQEDIPLCTDVRNRSIIIIRKFVRDGTSSLGNPYLAQNFLLNKKGKILYRGDTDNTYASEMKMVLNQMVANRYFDLALFIPQGQRIQDVAWLKGVSDRINKEGFTVLLFLTSLCSSCASGDVVNIIKDMSLTNGHKVKYTAIYYAREGREEDLSLMKSQLGLDGYIETIGADVALRSRWQELIDDFSVVELNNIVIVINEDGTIVHNYYRNCRECWSNMVTVLAGLS